MATYYVRPGGTGNGTGPALNQAWGTFQAPFTSGSGVTGGDTVYIAPGHYNEKVTVTIASPTSTLSIIGDVTGSQFSGVTAGPVRLSGFTSAGNAAANLTAPQFSATSKNYLSFSNIIFEGSPTGATGSNLVRFITSTNITFTKCLFVNETYATTATEGTLLHMSAPSSGAANHTISKCLFVVSGRTSVIIAGNNVADTTSISDCIFQGGTAEGLLLVNLQTSIRNCTFIGNTYQALIMSGGSASFFTTIRNCLFLYNTVAINASSANTTEDYNRFTSNATNRSGTIATGNNSSSVGASRLDYGYSRIAGLNPIDFYGPQQGSPNQGFGTSSGAEATDVMSIAWTGATPDAGYQTYSTVATLSPTYQPTDRNASTITIAPGSTSQSIELYLGATGLTASTSGLSAYYNRTRSADVQINLQARNITQNWTSGGFAEVNANTMPGVYRLDIPNEALAAGADDVTVVVRGASGTNGAVMSIKLSSGGLTSAQTASAVWDAATTSYTNNGSFGLNLLRADQQNKQGLVTLSSAGNVNRVDADVHAIANDIAAATALKGALNHDGTGYIDSDVVRVSTSTVAADELEGALLHNGTDYIDSNLLSGNSTRVFVGRFQLTQTGTTQGDIIEAFTTDTPSFELQLFDGDNNIVPVTGATLGLRILDVTSTVVETGTPTIEYGTGGIVRWTAPGSYVSIGCPAGMYRLFVDRTVSGTTTTFGPLQIKVQVQ